MGFQQLAGLIAFNATSIGTGNFVVASAYTGCMVPEQANVIDGKVYTYYAQSPDGTQWEQGSGAYSVLTHTLARTTVTGTSNGDTNTVNFAVTPPIVWVFPSSSASLETFQPAPSCGRLSYVSATSLQFLPYNGPYLRIKGIIYQIPGAGIVGLANTGVYVNGVAGQNLAVFTQYFVYAFINAGVITADFSTTSHSMDTTTGNVGTEIKTGDSTRTLIGMIYTNGIGQFQLSPIIGVLSWFNRRDLAIDAGVPNVTTTITTLINVNSGGAIGMLNWGDEAVFAEMAGALSVSGASYCSCAIGLDGSSGSAATQFALGAITYSTAGEVANVGGFASVTEGVHVYWAALGAISGGTASLLNSSMSGMTRG
jgi:hypothetical protein